MRKFLSMIASLLTLFVLSLTVFYVVKNISFKIEFKEIYPYNWWLLPLVILSSILAILFWIIQYKVYKRSLRNKNKIRFKYGIVGYSQVSKLKR
ncbi:MAG: hypothetical protein N2749_02070 [Clostridia bacterium]|nr:hypothetical protein [Clostridia bacterium]